MERNSLVPQQSQAVVNNDGISGVLPTSQYYPKITFNWPVKMFQVGPATDQNLQKEIIFEVIRMHMGIRKNQENDWDPNNYVPPTCFSLDGVMGSQPRVLRVLADGKEAGVYGECATCRFGSPQIGWGSRGLWKPPSDNWQPASKAPNCGTYTLLLALYNDVPTMIHIPSTGVRSVAKGFGAAATKGKNVREVVWKLLGTGGGQKGMDMTVIPDSFSDASRAEFLADLASQEEEKFQAACYNFAQGGKEEPSNGGGVVNA